MVYKSLPARAPRPAAAAAVQANVQRIGRTDTRHRPTHVATSGRSHHGMAPVQRDLRCAASTDSAGPPRHISFGDATAALAKASNAWEKYDKDRSGTLSLDEVGPPGSSTCLLTHAHCYAIGSQQLMTIKHAGEPVSGCCMGAALTAAPLPLPRSSMQVTHLVNGPEMKDALLTLANVTPRQR